MNKKIAAIVCAAALTVPVFVINADYSESDIKTAVKSAISWKNEYDNPFYSIGTNGSNLYITALHSLGENYDYATYLHGLDGIAAGYGAAHDASDMQRTALAVISSGGDAQNIGGRDLIADSTFYRAATAPLGKDGSDGYSWALIVLDAGGFETPDWASENKNQIIAGLLSRQNSDGSFDESVYSTASAITALAPYADETGAYTITQQETGQTFDLSPHDAVNMALAYLSDTQTKDGDWGNSISTAMAVIALDTVGIDCDKDENFTARNGSALDGLMSYRNTDGGFALNAKKSDGEATSYALCALVSHLRFEQGKAPLFRLNVGDTASISTPAPATQAPSSQTTPTTATPTSAPSATATPRATYRPTSTVSPTRAPSNTMRPTRTAAPTSSPSADSDDDDTTPTARPRVTPTPRPTQRPALVGPVDVQGPVQPTETPEILDKGHATVTEEKSIVPVIIIIAGSVLLVLLALAAAAILLKKKNGGVKSRLAGKNVQSANKSYSAKLHRQTEQHRKFEERRRFEQREKYKQRMKYKKR